MKGPVSVWGVGPGTGSFSVHPWQGEFIVSKVTGGRPVWGVIPGPGPGGASSESSGQVLP